MTVYSNKRYLCGSCSSRHGECSIDISVSNFRPKSKKFCSIRDNNIKNQIIWSQNQFPQLFFCQRRLVFWQSCRSFPTKNRKKQRKWNVSRENHLFEGVSLQENKDFLIVVQGTFWWEKDKTFCQSSDKRFVCHFEKNTFTSKCSLGYVDCTIDSPLEKFCQK